MTETVTTPPAKADDEVKAVTQQELVDKASKYIKKIPMTLLWGAVFYATFIPGGIVLGGLAAGAAASYFGAGAILTTGAAVLGVAAGGVGGFFGAGWAFREKVSDLALSLGLDASEMTLRSLRRLFKQAKEKKGGAEMAPKTAKMERGVEKVHKLSLTLRKWFGDSSEPKKAEEQKEEAPKASSPATAKPGAPGA